MAEVDHAGNLAWREGEVMRSVNQNKHAEGLKAALSTPPYGATQDILDRSYAVVFSCLSGIKGDQAARLAGELAQEEQDALIKYVYHGLGRDDTPDDKQRRQQNCTVLLAWHAALREKAGMGVLVRATTGYPL